MVPWWILGKILFVSLLAIVPFYLFKEGRVNLVELGLSFTVYGLVYLLLALMFKLTTVSEINTQYLQPILSKFNKNRSRY